MTVVCWWVIWDWRGHSDLISTVGRTLPGTFETPFSWALLFWVPLTLSLGIFLFQCYTVDKAILRLKWTVTDTLRQAWWRLVSFVIPLLMVAAGFDSILEGRVRGVVWLFAAGEVARIGTGFLRRAEGIKFNADRFAELFMTHPTFVQRVQAIANGHMPADIVADILKDSGVSVFSSLSQ